MATKLTPEQIAQRQEKALRREIIREKRREWRTEYRIKNNLPLCS